MAIESVTAPIYGKKYAPLKRFSWPWRILATYTSFLTWLVSTPWLAIKAVAPYNLQDNLAEVESSFFSFVTPIINFVQDTTYKAFSVADNTADWAINTATHVYKNNLAGFEHTFDRVLSNVEYRTSLLKDGGLSAIPKALSFDLATSPTPTKPLAGTPAAPLVDKLS